MVFGFLKRAFGEKKKARTGGSDERRRHERVYGTVYAGVQRVNRTLHPEMADSILYCQVNDFSVGGIQFSASEHFDPGDDLTIQLTVPSRFGGTRSITQRGMIRWAGLGEGTETYFMGVEFHGASRYDRAMWFDYVDFKTKFNITQKSSTDSV